ncbi:MAG: anaerobic ribonucleoside-triphosphate reductase activating protein, partial [Clostridia bacterium]|nr:anaerobic ribonucleoside-triphosphate reductase activating protein [Clostridia bacterium]
QKTSFVDYPGQPAAVVFTPYCNFNCSYCHNAQILKQDAPLMDEAQVWAYLERRAGTLKALVISGGEPTLQQNLEAFAGRAKALGYLVKLDTNGTKPQVLRTLMKKGLLDYIAMDIKAPPEAYARVTRVEADMAAIRQSIALIRNSGLPHEFRTTFCPELSVEEVAAAAALVQGAERYYLQQYRVRDASDPAPHPPSVLRAAAEAVKKSGMDCVVRGLGAER